MSDKKKHTHSEVELETGRVTEIPVGGDQDTSESEPLTPLSKPAPEPIEVLKARVAELEDLRLRALAEVDNTRKRLNRQMDEALRSCNDRLLLDLLEVVDNFDRALKHANENCEAEGGAAKSLREGMELTYNLLLGVLSRYEVRPMESIGKRFDPTYHEALAHVESADYGEGLVAAEINRGYMIGARVLRHARVAVSKGAPKTSDIDEEVD